jgi:hypothetical protein
MACKLGDALPGGEHLLRAADVRSAAVAIHRLAALDVGVSEEQPGGARSPRMDRSTQCVAAGFSRGRRGHVPGLDSPIRV